MCGELAFFGVKLDMAANISGEPRISTADSEVSVWVIPTNEELMIAQHTLALIDPRAHSLQVKAAEKVQGEPHDGSEPENR